MAEEDKTPEVEGEGGAEAAEAEEGPSALDDLHAAATEHAANLHAAASEAIGEHVAYVSSMFGGSGEEGGDVVVAGDEIDVPDFTPFEIEAVKLGDLETSTSDVGNTTLTVAITPKASQEGLPYNTKPALRSASDFGWLRSVLVQQTPGSIVPAVPKFALASYMVTDDDVSQQSTDALEVFLKRVLAHQELGTSLVVKSFCLAEPEVFEYLKKMTPSIDTSVPVHVHVKAVIESGKDTLGLQPAGATHVVVDEDAEEVGKIRKWVDDLHARLTAVQAKARTMRDAAESAAAEKGFFTQAVLAMAAQQDSANSMGLKDLKELSDVNKEQANTTVTVLLEQLRDLIACEQALSEAIASRDHKKLQLQAAKKHHEDTTASFHAGTDARAASEATNAEFELAAKEAGAGKPKIDIDALGLSAEQQASAREVFGMFDSDGSGVISSQELGACFEAMGKRLSRVELRQMIAKVDKDQTGDISYAEFLQLVAPLIQGKDLSSAEDLMNATSAGFGVGGVDAAAFSKLAGLKLSAVFNGVVASASSSEEDLANAEADLERLEVEWARANARLLRESKHFRETSVERLRKVFLAYFSVEHQYTVRLNKMYTKMIEQLGGHLLGQLPMSA